MKSSLAEDSSIRLGKLIGEIEYHQLGPTLIVALYHLEIGGTQPQCQTAEDVWQITKSGTEHRIQAAEQVLNQQGIPLP